MGRCSSIISCSADAWPSSVPKLLKARAIDRSRHCTRSIRDVSTPSESRACVRRAVALRADYATADGRVWLGLIRNLSFQGMFIESALRHVAHEVAPGNLITVIASASGVVWSFWGDIRNRSSILCITGFRSMDQHGEVGYGRHQGWVVHCIHFPLRLSLLVYLFSHAYASKNMCDTALPARRMRPLHVSGSPQLVIAFFFVDEDAHNFPVSNKTPQVLDPGLCDSPPLLQQEKGLVPNINIPLATV
jgi:hypothetical protein